MKLGIIVNNQNILEKINKMDLPGSKVLKLRKIIKKFMEELRQFEEEKNNYILKHGENGELNRDSNPEAYEKAILFLNEMMNSEIDIEPAPILDDSDIENNKFSVADLDRLEALGLYKPDSDEKIS